MIRGISSPPRPQRPPSAWAEILRRPARRAAWWVYLLPFVAAYYLAGILTNPVEAVVTLAGVVALVGVWVILRNPIRGLEMSLVIFPFYTFIRGAMMYLKIPAPLELLGMWTEVVTILMVASIILICVRQRTRLRLTWYDGPVLLFMGSVLYGIVLTLSEQEWVAALYGAHMSLFGMAFYLVTRWLTLTTAQVRRLLCFWLISFALMAAISLLDYAFRFDFVIECAMQIRSGYWLLFEPHDFFRWYPRMQSLMFAEQVFGTLCAFGAIYCLSRWGMKPRPRFLPPLLALMLVCLALSMSRGALACFLAACGALLFLRGSHRRIVLTCLTLLSLVGITLVVTGTPAAQTLIERTLSVTDTNNQLAYGRVGQWQLALDAFPRFPSGLGVGRVGASSLFHGTGSETGVSVVDGGIFKIMAEQGLPGLILFGIGTVLFFVTFVPIHNNLVERARRGDAWAQEGSVLGACILSLMVGLQVQNIGGNIFDSFFVQPVYWMLCGLFVRCYEYSLAQTDQERQERLASRLQMLTNPSRRTLKPLPSPTGEGHG